MTSPIQIKVSATHTVSGELTLPSNAKYILALAHGAGAGMKHIFMTRLSEELANHSIATLRYNFPYMEAKKKRPDVPAVAHAAVHAAIDKSRELCPGLPVIAGGKSFGGRMTSQYAAKNKPVLKGIVFFGFPLHPIGNPSIERADHLKDVNVPMLFLQGTKDELAEEGLISEVCSYLPFATLHFFDKANHAFKSGKQDLIPDLALQTANWLQQI
jgi:predicted alpha/beta-hydrolase family hydrolase